MCPGVLLALARFIPAGAGNTLPLSALLARNTVYPRWRGEHRSSHYFPFFFDGLSPLARGTRRQRIVRLPLHRFIPAGAGNTGKTNIGVRVVPVYPRWRGEHSIRRFCSSSDAGLSPLARGTPRKRLPASLICRFIPAGAGNTKFILINTAFVSVYPRWRGEHIKSSENSGNQVGLSPLARGTRRRFIVNVQPQRFIPAGAGNTTGQPQRFTVMPVYPRWRGEHSKHNLLLINDFLSQSQSTNFTVSHKQHIHYVKEHLIH